MGGDSAATGVGVELNVGGTWALVRVVHAVPIALLGGLFANLQPVILAILDTTGVLEGLGEEVAQVVVVGGIFESKVAHIGQVLFELEGEAFAEVLDGSRLLLLANLLVLLFVRSRLQALPRQTAAQEVHEDVAQSLEVVTP